MKNEIKYILMAGGLPFLLLSIGIMVSFAVYPNDVDGAGKVVIGSFYTGVLLSIFLVVHRIRKLYEAYKSN